MDVLRGVRREEVVLAYLRAELGWVLCNDKIADLIACKVSDCGNIEELLQNLTRALTRDIRHHSWLYNQLYCRNMKWSRVRLDVSEPDVMPMGCKPGEWHYPKLDKFVEELREAVCSSRTIPGLNDNPAELLGKSPENCPCIIAVHGTYDGKCYSHAIADGAHRAIGWAARGEESLEAYYGESP